MTKQQANALLKFRELLLGEALTAVEYYNNPDYPELKLLSRIPATPLATNLQRLDITLNSIGITVATPDEITNFMGELLGEL